VWRCPNQCVQIDLALLFIKEVAHLKEKSGTFSVFKEPVNFVVLDVVECHVLKVSDENIGQGISVKVCDWNNLYNAFINSWVLNFDGDLSFASVNQLNIVLVSVNSNSTNKFVNFIFNEACNIKPFEVGFLLIFRKGEGSFICAKEHPI